ncbi:MAG: hypothetical protein WAS21_26910 [Geminicoccaceae bacterium]
MPFAAYLLADAIECSGILVAVAAGITMSFVEQKGSVLAVTRIRRNVVWETVYVGASGTIFILLGEQLPDIVAGAAKVVRAAGQRDAGGLVGYVRRDQSRSCGPTLFLGVDLAPAHFLPVRP